MRTVSRLMRFALGIFAACAVALFCEVGSARAAEAAAWQPVPFLQLPEGWTLGACSAVAIDSRGEIFLFHRGEHPVIVCDAAGKIVRSWGDGAIGSAHGLRIDANDDVWLTDIGNHRVLKFDGHGKLLLSLGTGKAGDGADAFNKPTDVAFGSRGEFYVADGYGNSRVLKFSPSGALLHTWGALGSQRGEFRIPHAIVRDRKGRLLVGDRENDRIQVFDEDGKLLEVWSGFAPYGLALDREGRTYVADGRANEVLRLDEAGRVVERFGRKGRAAGEFDMPHMLAFDAAGNLFVTEINGRRVQKFVRR
ncbi:MAG: peptidyl-alpha-hydroxyglycine alpha-amidating lyase family protein [Planctomycetia bacterium]|nr:peptidyl-alpha-hydroxyglycine alpha-amidating lyase family protein [Planctomycetia bacterium]